MTAKAEPTPVRELPSGADVRLVVCDMDGTLLGADGKISLRTWEAIRAMRDAGIAFAPASGRQYSTLAGVFADIHAGLTVIAENGTVVMRDGQPLAISPLPAGVVPAAVEVARSFGSYTGRDGAGVVVCTPTMAYVERGDPDFLREVRHYYHALEVVPDLLEIGEGEAIKVAVFTFDDAETVLAPPLRSAGLPDIAEVVVSGKHWVDLMPPGVDKGVALERLQNRLGITPAETMAFGDYLNDLEMLDRAEMSFAMANAHPAVIDRARYVAPANDVDGVAQILEFLVGPHIGYTGPLERGARG